ncbi:Uncharacterised protein [Pandoraea pnomenusa]|uniref:Uncharacterized protein n=1 Tax=Pandoraea pnomenusa TaxID=93220 RepID=A0A378YZN7_9BURK|nr:Uncharacterised protein [Pandoraea pnomenusa]
MEALRAEGFERIDFVIPEGGRAAKYPGEHAEDGGETVLNFVTANGRVLRTIRASGGRGAQSTCEIPAGSREITPADISAGFRVSAILPADVVYVRDGVCSLLGGGFTFSNVESIPVDISWILLLKLDFGASVDNMSLAMFVTVDDPYGREVLRLPVVAQREHEAEPGRVACVSLRFTARKSGPQRDSSTVWSIRFGSDVDRGQAVSGVTRTDYSAFDGDAGKFQRRSNPAEILRNGDDTRDRDAANDLDDVFEQPGFKAH